MGCFYYMFKLPLLARLPCCLQRVGFGFVRDHEHFWWGVEFRKQFHLILIDDGFPGGANRNQLFHAPLLDRATHIRNRRVHIAKTQKPLR